MEKFAVIGRQSLADLLSSVGIALILPTSDEALVGQELWKYDPFEYIVVASTPMSKKAEAFLEILITRGACVLVVKEHEDDQVALPSVRVVESSATINDLLATAECRPIIGGDIPLSSEVPSYFTPTDEAQQDDDGEDATSDETDLQEPEYLEDEVEPTRLAPPPPQPEPELIESPEPEPTRLAPPPPQPEPELIESPDPTQSTPPPPQWERQEPTPPKQPFGGLLKPKSNPSPQPVVRPAPTPEPATSQNQTAQPTPDAMFFNPTQDPVYSPSPQPVVQPTPSPALNPTQMMQSTPEPAVRTTPEPATNQNQTTQPTPDAMFNPTQSPVFNPAPQPVVQPTPVVKVNNSPDRDFARRVADTISDNNAGIMDSTTIASVFGVDEDRAKELAQVLVVFSGKGGVGKTSTSILSAKIAASANPEARVVLIDGNRGQGDIRGYLFGSRPPTDIPSISDYAIGAKMADCLLPPSKIPMEDVNFYTLLAPDVDESKGHVNDEVYSQAIAELRNVCDIVIIDTQIAEAHSEQPLINHVIIPIMKEGGYGLCLFDSSNVSIRNGLTLLQSYVNAGVDPNRLLALFNRLVVDPAPDALVRLLGGLATLAGIVPDMSNQFNTSIIVRSLPADSVYAHSILKVLGAVTKDPVYEDALHTLKFNSNDDASDEAISSWIGKFSSKFRKR
jgi:Mrp family chromosome partitioning ATPase